MLVIQGKEGLWVYMQKNYRAYSEKTSLPSVYVETLMNKDPRGKLTWLVCLLSCFSCVWLFETLWNPMEPFSFPGFSVHGILQARILEWVAMPCSRESSQSKDWTHVSHLLHWHVGSLALVHLGTLNLL